MDKQLFQHYQNLAKYNRLANLSIYKACQALSDEQRKENRGAFFGSIHATLNHILVGDRLWVGRFEGQPVTLKLDQILFEDFEELWQARQVEDERIQGFVNSLENKDVSGNLEFVNYLGQTMSVTWLVGLSQLFNHQIHHRGQVHTLLTQFGLEGPVLDIHYLFRDKG